jgi:hypothetical protein
MISLRDKHFANRLPCGLLNFPRAVSAFLLCGMIAFAGPLSSPMVSAAPVIYVVPSFTRVWGPDEVFSVNLTITGVIDLYACEINVYYDPTILNGTGVVEGPFLKSQGITFFTTNFNDNFNETHGLVRVADSVLGNVPGVSGSGVIATVTFLSKHVGSSALALAGTKLADSHTVPISHTDSSGSVEVVPVERNVAVTSVNASVSQACVGQTVSVYVLVANKGNKTETFNVTAYANDTAIGVQTVSNLARNSNLTVTVPWDTTDFALGDYVLRAEAQSVPGETDLSNNVLVGGVVTIVPGEHDVTVEDVMVSDYEFHEGQSAEILVVLSNSGNYTETFSVSVYYGENYISAQTVVGLVSAGERTLTFTWNTTGYPLNVGLPVRAFADAVAGEMNLEDNTFEDGDVTILPALIPSLTIMEVVPSNQVGDPLSGFKVGTMAYFKVTITATSMGSQPVLVTLSAFDAQQVSIGVVFFQGPLVSGTSSFVLGVPLSQTAHVGTSLVYANIFSDWPHLGGTPLCPEGSASFQIRVT